METSQDREGREMRGKKSGNVVVEDDPKVMEFTEGDLVALTQAALRVNDIANMRPRKLYEIGAPNEFVVLHTFMHDAEGPCLTLYPCCTRFIDRQSGKPYCTGHPVIYFEKIGRKRLPKKGDKSAAIQVPFVPGELVGMHFEEDEDNPKLSLNILGKQLSISGPLAKSVKKFAEENNYL
jgi:hypothetical protein